MEYIVKDISDSLNFWRVGRVYRFGKTVKAVKCDGISQKDKLYIEMAARKLSNGILKRQNKVKPSLKVRRYFI